MTHKGFSPQTLDLFEVTLTIPTPPDTASAPGTPPGLAALSDAELACRLGEIVEEVQRRLAKGRGGRPDLTAAAQQAGRSLQTLGPSPAKPARSSRRAKAPTVLQDGQRKAVRAALRAGVPPQQVARHFGLSPATIRKVLDESA